MADEKKVTVDTNMHMTEDKEHIIPDEALDTVTGGVAGAQNINVGSTKDHSNKPFLG